jgi:uncharacterized protein YbcI
MRIAVPTTIVSPGRHVKCSVQLFAGNCGVLLINGGWVRLKDSTSARIRSLTAPLVREYAFLRPGVAEVDATPAAGGAPLTGGHLLAAISTRIVGILREHYGRGPMKAKTYALDDIIVVVMRGSGFTALEQTIMDSGEPERVIAMREDFQRVMAKLYRETIEELTGRKVLAFLSQAHVEPDITMEIFFVDGPLEGFGAIEINEPE